MGSFSWFGYSVCTCIYLCIGILVISLSLQWDDSIDNMPQGIPPRRKKRKWTPLEEETLRTGVKMYMLALK